MKRRTRKYTKKKRSPPEQPEFIFFIWHIFAKTSYPNVTEVLGGHALSYCEQRSKRKMFVSICSTSGGRTNNLHSSLYIINNTRSFCFDETFHLKKLSFYSRWIFAGLMGKFSGVSPNDEGDFFSLEMKNTVLGHIRDTFWMRLEHKCGLSAGKCNYQRGKNDKRENSRRRILKKIGSV